MTAYSLSSDHLPGTSKLVEELGEVQQVIGKIMGLGAMRAAHWDGSYLDQRMVEELG